ncbi:MAG: ABC transporter permease [Pseudomonadota bacterium]
MIAAEILKLRRQRAALFWGFLFLPLFMTLLAFLLGGGLVKPPPDALVSEIRLFRSVVRTLSVAGNPIAQLFYAVGAAAIFAVEYRYSGWRHLVPRAPRERLLAAKFAAFALFAALSLVLAVAGDLLVMLAMPFVQGLNPAIVETPPGAATILLLAFLVSFAELMALGGLVALVAVTTRSAMGAILVPFLLSLGAAAAGAYFGEAVRTLPMPTYAAEALRHWLESGPSPASDRAALIGLATLLAWIAAGFGAAIALFRRQDLVSE